MKLVHILAAVDLGAQHDAVLRRAFDLAQLHGGRLTILHVIAGLDPAGVQSLSDADRKNLHNAEAREARNLIEAAARACVPSGGERPGVDWSVVIEAGPPAVQVVAVAERLGVDLVIVAAHQRKSLRDKVLGSTADRILRSAARPVLVVKRPPERPYRNVLVATDFSQASDTAAVAAIALCPGARLQLIHVADVPPQFERALLRVGGGASIEDYRRKLVSRARVRLREIAARQDGAAERLRGRVVQGDPAATLVRMTWNRDVDLIAVGPRGHGTVLSTLLGSVARHLLREAACDVLIARAVAGAEDAESHR
jgi:nucleotide-binding universal stress UspA family protein